MSVGEAKYSNPLHHDLHWADLRTTDALCNYLVPGVGDTQVRWAERGLRSGAEFLLDGQS